MIVCIPYHSRDFQLAKKLSERIAKLGNVSEFTCLLIHEEGITNQGIIEPLRSVFKEVKELIVQDVPVADWSAGTGDARAANEVWIQTAWYIHYKIKDYWLWLEPDCVVMHASWAKDFRAEYVKCQRRVMGAEVIPSNGVKRLSGIAMYPPSVCECGNSALIAHRIPWDVAGATDFLKHGYATKQIYHVLRTSKDAPTFPTLNELRLIPEGTAIFHPCKDGSLIDRLNEKEGGAVIEYPSVGPTTEDYVERLKPDAFGSGYCTNKSQDDLVGEYQKASPLPLSTVLMAENDSLKARIAELEAIIKSMSEMNEAPKKKTVYKVKKRTPEQQKALNERMAKARAGRKAKLTGVK